MKSLFYPEFNKIEIAEQPMPELGSKEVLIKVAACGICGSELESFKNQSPRRTPPLIMGHEFCGTIEQLGADVSDFEAGQKVVSNSIVSCNICIRCRRGDTHLCAKRQIFGMHRNGAFAEYINVPENCLIPWPENLPAEAACLAEPLANGLHIVHLTEHLDPKNILVIGAGPIGLMVIQAFRTIKDPEIYVAEIREERLKVAMQLGAKKAMNPQQSNLTEEIHKLTEGEGADLVIDAVGSSRTNQQAVEAVRPGGTVVLIGLHENSSSIESYEIILSEKHVLGTYAAKMEELEQALELMSNGSVDVASWVAIATLNNGVGLFHQMLDGNNIKGVITL